jgi:hypothetical protein
MRKLYDRPLARISENSFFKLIDIRAYQKKENYNKEKAGSMEGEVNVELMKNKKFSTDDLVRHYIHVCRDLKTIEPTLEQLFDCSGIQKTTWYKQQNKSSFWHLLMEKIEHSINQAKKQEKIDFWIEAKQIAHNKYADLFMKESGRKERKIDDLSKNRRRSF